MNDNMTSWIIVEVWYLSLAQFYIFKDWCIENLRPDEWATSIGNYKFKNEIDVVAFKLKFGL